MNPQDPLAELQPLRAPELIDWWPPAPGWWIVSILFVLALVSLLYFLYKRHKRNAYRRRALAQLASLHADVQANNQTASYVQDVNALLKSVAMLSYTPSIVAAQHGEAWRQFLNGGLPADKHLPAAFNEAAYQRSSPELDVEQVHAAAQRWIKSHRAKP